MAVFPRKEEKVNYILEQMNDIDDEAEFKRLFKELYPDEWKKIIATYNKEEKADKKGKGHPMPAPEIYLSNAYKVGKKKYLSKETLI